MSLGYHAGDRAARAFMESLAARVLKVEGAPSTLAAYFFGPDLAPVVLEAHKRLAWIDMPRQHGWETTITIKVDGSCVFEALHVPTSRTLKLKARTEFQALIAGSLHCLASDIEP